MLLYLYKAHYINKDMSNDLLGLNYTYLILKNDELDMQKENIITDK